MPFSACECRPVKIIAKLQKQVDDWNNKFPPGQKVNVLLDGGSTFHTTTRSRAQLLGGHSAVVWLDGISGCYLLERCHPWLPNDMP